MLFRTSTPVPERFQLSPADVDRLLTAASWFEVSVCKTATPSMATVCVFDQGLLRTFSVPAGLAHLRVLTEVCERAAPWVHFHEGEHCARTLLRNSDARLRRIAELYKERALEPGGALAAHATTLPSSAAGDSFSLRRLKHSALPKS